MISTEDALKMVEEINKEEPKTEAKEETKETVNPESKPAEEVKETQTPSETPSEVKGGEQKTETKTDDKVEEKKSEVDKAQDQADKVAEKPEEKPEDKKPTKQEQRDFAFIREKNKRKEQKIKYEKRIKELEDELNKYKDLKLEHFKDKDGNQDQSSYLDWKFREMDLKNEVKSLKAQEEQDEARYIEEENRRRTELSFPDENERLEYQKLLESKGQSFLEALNEADPNGVVLGYLSSQEKYPIVMKKLMTDMDALRKVFRSHDPDILKYNIAQFCEEVLTSKPVPSQKEINQPQPSVQPTQTPEKKEMPILGKQMTSTQPTGSENQLKTPADWNDYLRKHPRGR